jgi:hypothetical protein
VVEAFNIRLIDLRGMLSSLPWLDYAQIRSSCRRDRSLACLAAIAGDESAAAGAVAEARAELGGRRQAITGAALRYAEGVMAWHRGELADAEHIVREATVQWRHGCDLMAASDGIELLGVVAAARERFLDAAACSPPLKRPGGRCSTWPPDSPPTGCRRPGPAHPRRGSFHPGMGNKASNSPWTTR